MTTQPLTNEQQAAIRAREEVLAALSAAGAFCGACDFESGDVGCPDCVRVREMYAEAVMPVIDRLRAERDLLRAGVQERAALLEEARGVLEAAGLTGSHGDDWPAVAPAIRRLASERDAAVAQLAGVWPCVCSHLPDQHDYDAVIGRNFCRSCPTDGDLHDFEAAAAPTA